MAEGLSKEQKQAKVIAKAIFDELKEEIREEMKVVAKAMFDELKMMQKEQQVVYDKKTGRIEKIITKMQN